MTATEISYVKMRIAEAIASRMLDGLTYDEAIREALEYCNRRWPRMMAAITA